MEMSPCPYCGSPNTHVDFYLKIRCDNCRRIFHPCNGNYRIETISPILCVKCSITSAEDVIRIYGKSFTEHANILFPNYDVPDPR